MRSLLGLALASALLSAAPAKPTFYKDVLPILQTRCQGCHRPGEAAPMSLLTYEQTRPLAAAIRQSITTGQMPPWSADPKHGKFANDPTLTAAEKATLLAWVDAKAPAGDPKHAPQPRHFVEGWNIGEPDLVVAMPNSPWLKSAERAKTIEGGNVPR
jgi:hypothetical protein